MNGSIDEISHSLTAGDFRIQARDRNSGARAGLLYTSHGIVETPIFMPVGTQATVKGVDQQTLESVVKAQIILANTYHLMLRPGEGVVSQAGGIHKFMNWEKPVLTDSGGYQVYSLGQMRKISEEGVSFQSHIDGATYKLTPESAVDIQMQLGADIIMAFDECTPYPCEKDYASRSLELTNRWLDRCIAYFNSRDPLHGYGQILVPIVQGSTYGDLRRRSAEYVASKNLKINAIGGLSVGEPHEEMYAMTDVVCGILPQDKPRYLMGVGTPENLLECISLGIDMFDCVLPSRNARHGLLYTSQGVINIKNEKWKMDYSPIDPDLDSWSQNYSRAYLRHLVLSGEYLGAIIATVHNLSFYLWLAGEARSQIAAGSFSSWKKEMTARVVRRL